VPGPIDFLRLAALAVFLGLVAVGLWLLNVVWWVIPPVMLAALLVAWTIEWLAWRQGRLPIMPIEGLEGSATAPVEEPLPPPPPQGFLPPAEPQAVPETAAAHADASSVVTFRPRTVEPRSWNLWDLERLAREGAKEHPERRDEWGYLFLNLRQFADADGSLPAEFDALVRETFGNLLEHSRA